MRLPASFSPSRAISVAIGQILICCLALPAIAQPKAPVRDPGQRLAWHRQHLSMREKSAFKNLRWQSIGPQIMAGRVTDIAVPRGREFTIYLATASGGVWRSVNEGTTWEPIFDEAPSGSVGDITIAPSDPDRIWVGLGEANIFRSSMSGTGVYRSRDGGETWQHMGLADSQHVGRIVIHPTDPNVVYVAASGHEYTANDERGVYKTTNGGITWTRVLHVNDHTGAIDLVMDPSNPRLLYAAMWDRTRHAWNDPKPGPGSGIYRTLDGGRTWKQLDNGLPAKESTGRIGLDIARSRPNVVYALIDNHETARPVEPGERDPYGRPRQHVIKGAVLYRSDDRGESWNAVSRSDRSMEYLFATYGWVFGQVRVDPTDENTVYVMGVPLLRSTDGGKSFERLGFRGLHGDHHAMWIDPKRPGHILNGNDGGLNISYDRGATWKNIENLGVVQFYNVAVDMAEPFNVYGSIQDNGSWMGPVTHRPGRDRGTDWKPIPGGEASIIAIDPSDPNTLYSESFYGRIQRSTLEPRETVSIVPKAGEGEPPLRGQWLAPFILSPHDPKTIYHGMQYLFRSRDRGDSWERISPDLTYDDPEKQGDIPFATITSISESPVRAGLLYVGTDDGKVHVSQDDGRQWSTIMQGLPPHKWVSRIIASRYDEGTVFLAQNGKRDDDFAAYLYKSVDYGHTWIDISAGIPGGPINVIREDPHVESVLYVGTDLGVYVSVDGAASWEVLGQGLPITFVHDLVVHPRDNVLVAATHGRGMWTLDVTEVQKKGRNRQLASASEKPDGAEGRVDLVSEAR